MASYTETITADRRLVILRLLHEQDDGALADSPLHSALRLLGHGVPRDTLKADLDFLEGEHLVLLSHPMPDFTLVEIAQRGEDVVNRVEKVAGVAVPSRRPR